jgi:hypothetical protein
MSEGESRPHDVICEDWELFEAERRWIHDYETQEKLWEKIRQKFFKYFKPDFDMSSAA